MKNKLLYIFAILLFIFIFRYFITDEYLELLTQVSFSDIAISILIALLIFAISGFQFSYILNRNSGVQLSLTDKLFFPISRNLWSYIIPFQGSLAYSVAFCKLKYNVAVAKGISINIYLLLFNIFITGIIGLYFSVLKNDFNSGIFFTSALFLFSPIILVFLNFTIRFVPNFESNSFQKVKKFLETILTDVSILWKDVKFSFNILLFNLFHTAITVLWFYWAVYILNLNIDLISILFLSLILKISLIFKITPGNLGVEQLLSGAVFVLLEQNAADGVIISLFNKVITIILAGTIGTTFTIYNLKYFKNKNIFKYLKNHTSNNINDKVI